MKKKFLPFVNRRFAHNPGAAGDLTASEQLQFKLKAEEKWIGGKYEDDLKPFCDALITQLNKQTARFDELSNSNKDNSVLLTWLKSCGIATSAFDRAADSCAITGTELESDSQEYQFDLFQKIGFTIDAEKIRTNIYEREEQVAHILMKGDKQMSEWLTGQYMLALKASAGPNIPAINGEGLPMTWDDANTTTDIPVANMNVKIVASLVKQMQLNKVVSGFYIDRGGLFEAWVDAGYDTGNAEGKGDGARKSAVDMTFDMWNFSAAGIAEEMFLVSANAIAVKTYNRFGDKPEEVGGKINQTRYRMKSNILPGVYWDVRYELTCVAGHDKHTWQFESEAGIFLNPESCPVTANVNGVPTQVTPSGVYSFTKVA